MNATTAESQARRPKAGTYVALMLITFPAVGAWTVVMWLTLDSWASGQLSAMRTIAGLIVLSWIAILLTLLARVGWKRRGNVKHAPDTHSENQTP